jgi:hypothetical protein
VKQAARRAAAAAVAALLTGACVTPIPEPVWSPCQAIASSDWAAEIRIIPSRHNRPLMRRFLFVSGKVTVPGPDFSVRLDEGPVARLDEPVQQMVVRAEGPEPAEGAAPVVHSVSATIPARKRYGGIEIRCGDGIIGRIAEVTGPAV